MIDLSPLNSVHDDSTIRSVLHLGGRLPFLVRPEFFVLGSFETFASVLFWEGSFSPVRRPGVWTVLDSSGGITKVFAHLGLSLRSICHDLRIVSFQVRFGAQVSFDAPWLGNVTQVTRVFPIELLITNILEVGSRFLALLEPPARM